ncbi:TonB-dependent receptor domain-containing protein [Aquiflexum gelatinilyticum]|uniref:TonB-dependent receptor n=1 Tax=Aquiflexum gelatinilyticum TaxID=2961943 RepID=A0A9X2SZF7_9BACT|nr:TonB-dependent receptor [Aquiflexum gelatinilyticum]MCR9013881.1 TonB-dependent receptor [Aquiflexum gelatinilyticum]
MKSYLPFQKSILLAMIFLALSISSSFPQNLKKFQVLDQQTQEPIIGLIYYYASQKGLSDEKGFIQLEYEAGTSIHFSHINYGKWTLDEGSLLKVLEKGVLLRQENILNLQPVSVISLKMMDEKDQKILISDQERLHHDAGAILNLNPVVSSIRKSGAFAFDPVMRGFKYDQLNIVIDGLQSANAACPNRMDPPTSQIALNRIKQIEILKGPHALRYGIGLGGTINFIQEDPFFSSQGGVNGRFSTMYESNGNVLRNEGRVGFNGHNYDIGLLGSWSKGTDYVDGDGNFVPANFQRGTVGMFGDFKISNSDLLQVTVNRNFARDVDFPTLAMDLRSDDTWMGSLRHTRSFQGRKLQKWNTSGYFTFVDHLMDNGLRDLNPRMMNAKTPANTQNLGARTEGLWQLGKEKLYAGADFRSEAAQGTREREFLMGPNAGKTIYDKVWQDSRITKSGAFASIHAPIGNYVVSLAGRLDVNNAQASDNAEEFVQVNPTQSITQLNPGISAGIKRDLGKNFNAGLWLASVKRSGSITERFINYFPVGVDPYEMLGNPDLASETNNQVDLVFGFSKSKITAEVNLFAAYLNNYITAEKTELKPRIPTSPGVRQYVNIDRAVKTGFEAALSQALFYGISHQLMVAYTYGQNLVISEALPEIAPMDVRYSILGSHLDNKLHSAIRLRYVADQNRVSGSFSETASPRFTLLDIDVSYAVSSLIAIKGGAQNLLNETYYEHLNRPIAATGTPLFAPGRNFFLMVSFKFP